MSLTLNIGDIIRHNKRGSEYEVVGITLHRPYEDNRKLYLTLGILANDEPSWDISPYDHPGADFRFIVHFQKSSDAPPVVDIVIYRALEPKRGEPWLFARPAHEFTEDRFTCLSPTSAP